jgi:putative glutamine amidotransferase
MKTRGRPNIGVTGPDRGGEAAWLFTWLALSLAGARAVRITPRRHASLKIIHELDGLIIGGGADVNPKLYGQELLHIVQPPNLRSPRRLWQQLLDLLVLPLTWIARKAAAEKRGRESFSGKRFPTPFLRDKLEMTLLDAAVQRRLPILGICRGQQLINVYFGGSLHQDLKSFYVEDLEVRSILPRKRIVIEPRTRLAGVMQQSYRIVNALHQQAIAELGNGLIVAARDRNGIIQAIEHESLPFVIGVQLHPEYLPQHEHQRALFAQLVRQSRRGP